MLAKGTVCGEPGIDCTECKTQCGKCDDGETEWGCCGYCAWELDDNDYPFCSGFISESRVCAMASMSTTMNAACICDDEWAPYCCGDAQYGNECEAECEI